MTTSQSLASQIEKARKEMMTQSGPRAKTARAAGASVAPHNSKPTAMRHRYARLANILGKLNDGVITYAIAAPPISRL